MIQFPRDRTIPLTIAALSLGIALQVRDGLYSPIAIAFLALAVICTVATSFWGDRLSRAGHYTLVVAVVTQLILLLNVFPGSHDEPRTLKEYYSFLMIIVCTIPVVLAIHIRQLLLPSLSGLMLAYAAAGGLVLTMTPSPQMDVYLFQDDACDALMRKTNPYTITYPDVYGPGGAFVYGEGLARDGQLLFGFPYMPLTLCSNFIGHFVFGDYRFANLAAVAAAGLCIIFASSSLRGVLAATLLMFTPRGFFVLEQGWTEPLAVMLLATTVLCDARHRKLLPFVVGLLLASKQYMILLIPLLPLLTDWRDWRFHLKAIATASVVTLPLVLWDIGAFWRSAVTLQFHQPFREDALSFAALLARLGLPKLPSIVAIVAALVVAICCTKRLDRSPHSFPLAVALTFLTFFALNKQAFANYYFFVIAALCCAIATAAQSGAPRRAASPLDS